MMSDIFSSLSNRYVLPLRGNGGGHIFFYRYFAPTGQLINVVHCIYGQWLRSLFLYRYFAPMGQLINVVHCILGQWYSRGFRVLLITQRQFLGICENLKWNMMSNIFSSRSNRDVLPLRGNGRAQIYVYRFLAPTGRVWARGYFVFTGIGHL